MFRTATANIDAIARFGCLLATLAGLGATPALHAATLNPALLPKVESATFEVVAAKPAHDPLTYAKPLPMNLIPYQKRTDKYHSIGTAFAIGPNRYVTAGHVLLSGLNSLWGPIELRDDKGHVYAIDKIEKFSLRKDFVVFSLSKPPVNQQILPVDSHPALNQSVYAVGNALGTGVVIRGGLYTSDTPENQSGAWNWIRFSAAVSPGNSGGPLLDKNGKVIGVVLMKSPDENLNYALPIGEVLNAPAHEAVIDRRAASKFSLIDNTITGTFKARFALPKTLADFNATYLKLRHRYQAKELKALLAQDPDKIFPNGSGSDRVLHSTASLDSMPTLLKRNSNGIWIPKSSAAGKIQLKNNGYLQFGLMEGGTFAFHLRKPDNVSAATLYAQPQVLMKLLLKSGAIHRPVGSARIKVTSLGKPLQEKTYTDRWQRHWQITVWPLPFLNAKVIVLALPVPDGYAGLLQFTPAAMQFAVMILDKATLNFCNVAYDGTLAQWKDFLKQKALLPAALKPITVNAVYDKRFLYASSRLRFSFTPKLQKIATDSNLDLGFGFFQSDGKVVWDVGDVYISADINDGNDWINIKRHVKPSPDLSNDFKDHWNKIAQQQHPFDGVPRNDNDITKITTVVPSPAKSPSVLWTAFYAREGTQPQKLMESRLDLLMKHIVVSDHGTSTAAKSKATSH